MRRARAAERAHIEAPAASHDVAEPLPEGRTVRDERAAVPRHGTPGTTHARSRAVRVGRSALAVVSSTGLACVLLVLLGVLTWLGTLAQVELGLYAAQQRYFESFGLVHHAGPVPIPLPGGMLVLVLLAVNLIVGGLLRLRRGLATLGVLVAHVGILMLLAAGLVKTLCAREGHVTLHEGESAAHFESWQRWELAITEPIDGGRARELVVPEERFLQAREGAAARLRSAELPFEIEVERFLANCEPAPADAVAHVGSTVDGVFLREKPRDPTAERNLAGAHVTLVDRASGARRSGLVWAAERAPFVAEVGGRRFAIELRHERYPMPFTLTLDEFRKEDHPGTGMARSFESDVRVVEGAAARPVRISMNQPLRAGGLVVYQASWGPSNARPGEPLFSTFAVVSNPSDAWPLWSCVVIAAGLVFHFGRKLGRHVRAEARRA